jgi:hypothetical protein
MSMRISSAVALLLLAGCQERSADTRVLAAVEADQRRAADEDGRILCARGSATLARDCTVDRLQSRDGLILTLRHPDGRFHRVMVTGDGRGVVAADGAEIAKVAIKGADGIEVALGGDRYRLPATIAGK